MTYYIIIDAGVRYQTEVEAESEAEALEKVRSDPGEHEWEEIDAQFDTGTLRVR